MARDVNQLVWRSMMRLIARWQTRQKGTTVRALMMHVASGRYRPRASYPAPSKAPTLPAYDGGVGKGVPGSTRSRHFSADGSWSAVMLGSHGSDLHRRARFIRDGADILVAEPRKVVRKLVDEHVRGRFVRGCNRRLLIENPPSAVFRLVQQDFDDVVGRGRGDIAKRAVVVGERVALEPENVELDRQRRCRAHAAPCTLKSARRDLNGSSANNASRSLAASARNAAACDSGVTVADEQKVDLAARRTAFEQQSRRSTKRRGRLAAIAAVESTSVSQSGWNMFCGSRFLMTTRTGAFGRGKRSDSWNVRSVVRNSGVVSHSP